MTICRYFQQGTCRFGNRCRYDHVYTNNHSYGGGYAGGGDNNYYRNNYNYGGGYGPGGGGGGPGTGSAISNDRGGTSILRSKAQASSGLFGPPTSNTASYHPGFFSSNVNESKPALPQREVKEILQMLINEFVLWEHSGQWPLSCFSLFKEQGCFPGFTDYSPEEIRWFMYQARTMGNLEECQQLIKGIYDKAKLVKEQLITPSPEVFEILTRLSRGEKIETPMAPSTFSAQPTPSASIFGNSGGGNMQPATQVATSFTFTLPSKEPTSTNNQNFPAFGAPQGNVFSNTFGNPMFSNAPTPHAGSNIFGGAIQPPQVTPAFNAPMGNAFINANSGNQNAYDSGTYTPMEEMTEDSLNAFNAPVYTMGSVPIKPPPKELCGLRS